MLFHFSSVLCFCAVVPGSCLEKGFHFGVKQNPLYLFLSKGVCVSVSMCDASERKHCASVNYKASFNTSC